MNDSSTPKKNYNILIYILRCIPAVFILGTSIYLSSQPTLKYIPGFFGADKLVHFTCFAGLAFWVSFCFSRKAWSAKPLLFWFISISLVAVYGIFDEIHQSYVPGRSCSVFDWIADTSGAMFGSFVYNILINFLFNKKQKDLKNS